MPVYCTSKGKNMLSSSCTRMVTLLKHVSPIQKTSIAMLSSVRMTSGETEDSYSTNSQRQASVFNNIIKNPFHHLLHSFAKKNQPQVIRIADLGCATGHNTLSHVDFIVKTLKSLYRKESVTNPEFQVFFNDVPSNDFNDLFLLLHKRSHPEDYFVNASPRSFYNLLFPKDSMNVIFSNLALHWLSGVPESVRRSDSSLYNRGRTWINGASPEISEAFADQSQSDLCRFFEYRAREMTTGGVMFLCCMGRPDSYPPHKQVDPEGEYCGPEFNAAWKDLIDEKLITQDGFDGFNLPWYFPTAQEMRNAVEMTDAFEVEMIDVLRGVRCMENDDFLKWTSDCKEFGKTKASLVRSFVGSLLEDSLGCEVTDVFFKRLERRSSEFLEKGIIVPSPFVTCTVATLVKK